MKFRFFHRLMAIWAAVGSVVLVSNAGTGIFDTTQALFTAPYYIYPEGQLTRMAHTHLFYIGAADVPPGGLSVEYSFGLLGDGTLDFINGNIDGLYADLERPPAHLVPPYQIVGISVTGEEAEAGGLLLGANFPAAWSGSSFDSLFPGTSQADVVAQLRSGQLAGGTVELLIHQLIIGSATLQSQDPLPPPDPAEPWLGPNRLPGNVLGFSAQGDPVDLAVLTEHHLANPGTPTWAYPEFSLYSINPLILPESAVSPGFFVGLMIASGVRSLRRHASRSRGKGQDHSVPHEAA